MNSSFFCLRQRRAFSLVEIVLAMAIISFALLAVVGLLAISIDTSKRSGEATLLASMTSRVTSDLRGQPFATVQANIKTTSTSPQVYYFNDAGDPLTNATNALYRCDVVNGPADTASQDSLGTVNLLNLNLRFSWPATAVVANRTTKVIHASIARY